MISEHVGAGKHRLDRRTPAWIALAVVAACGPAAKTPTPIVVGEAPASEHEASRGTPCGSPTEKPDDGHEARASDVARVAIEGADDPVKLCAVLHTAAGLALDESVVSRDIHALWATGLVDDVKVTREQTPAGASILFSVVARPSYASTRLDGARGLSLDASLLPDAPGRLDPYVVHRTIDRLKDELHTSGYRSAEIAASTERGSSGTELVFRVEAGVQTRIGKVILEGEQRAQEKELLAAIRSAPGMPVAGDRAELDRLLIQAFYYDRGMLFARVDDPVIVDGPTPDVADLRITIHEGDVYRIGVVHVKGELLAEESEYLQRFWSSKPGDVFNRSLIAADLEKMKEFHTSRGFEASIEPETSIHEDKKIVDVTIEIGGPSSH